MVDRFHEKRYQLAARKQNEANIKQNYYEQTAKYFERQCGIAKQYDSWNTKSLDINKHLENAKKAEILLMRRHKLRNVLREEEEQYKKELEDLNKKKHQEPSLSLEALKEKLKEKRAEESLYLPQECRRYRSYFSSPKGSIKSPLNTLHNADSERSTCKDASNLKQINGHHRPVTDDDASKNQENSKEDNFHNTEGSVSPQTTDSSKQSKYSERYACRSLENTNLRRNNVPFEYATPTRRRRFATPLSNVFEPETPTNGREENIGHRQRSNENEHHTSCNQENGSSNLTDNSSVSKDMNGSENGIACLDQVDRSQKLRSLSAETSRTQLDQENNSDFENGTGKKRELCFVSQNEIDRNSYSIVSDSIDKQLSEQMRFYINHNEIKQKIEDLAKRELHASTNHCWDEALRLRDMRNRLELIREKKFYNENCLKMDDEIRNLGLYNIERREKELTGRENICTDTTIFSEEAKGLWQQWVQEDDKSVMKDARILRETLMKELEKDWQNLAIREKKRFVNSLHNVITGSALQDEHKLIAKLTDEKKKSLLNFAK